MNKTIEYNAIFKDFNKTKCRYRLARGSAGSGKSVNIAQDFISKLSNPKYNGANLLVLRKTDETNRNTTFAELQGAIYRMFGNLADRYWKITTNPLMLESLTTGSQIIFRGMNDDKQREKVKSITFKKGKLTWIWLEEATEFVENDIDILDDRLRGLLPNPNLYYQMTFSFNPVSASHWLKAKYFDYKDPDIFTHHSTYLQNRFIDEAYHRRMMRRKEQDPEGYMVYGLGEWGELGGLILTNYQVHNFNTNPDMFDKMFIGQDFGFNHANVILTIGWKDGEIYICDELYLFEKDTEEIIELAEGRFDKRIKMWCDSAEPDRIKMWRKRGYKAEGVVKEKGANGKTSVNAQIDFLKQHKIHIHPSCINTIKEIQQWKWEKDKQTGKYIDEPVCVFDDAMAALRYSIETIRKNKRSIYEALGC
ncbi:MAG: PBSX family phage terminase large subunit [Romboutsia timonensis]